MVERKTVVDGWTVAHGFVGFWSGIIRVPANYWSIMCVGFEIVEHLTLPHLEPPWYEIFANSALDVGAGVIGNIIGNETIKRVRKT